MPEQDAIDLIRQAFAFIAAYEGEIPGASEKECGNWREHSLAGAKQEAERFLPVIQNWSAERLQY